MLPAPKRRCGRYKNELGLVEPPAPIRRPEDLRVEERLLWWLWFPHSWLLRRLPAWVKSILFFWLTLSSMVVGFGVVEFGAVEIGSAFGGLPTWLKAALIAPLAIPILLIVLPFFITRTITILLWPWRKLSG